MKSILQEAEEIVNGERQSDYGSAKESFGKIAIISSIICNKDIYPEDIVKIQIAIKLVRESYNPKIDNRIDICGYAELLNRLEIQYGHG